MKFGMGKGHGMKQILVQRCPTFGNISMGIMDVLVGMTFEYVICVEPAPKDTICNVGATGDGGYVVCGGDLYKALQEDGAGGDLMQALTEKFGQWSEREFVFHVDDVVELPLRPQAA